MADAAHVDGHLLVRAHGGQPTGRHSCLLQRKKVHRLPVQCGDFCVNHKHSKAEASIIVCVTRQSLLGFFKILLIIIVKLLHVEQGFVWERQHTEH